MMTEHRGLSLCTFAAIQGISEVPHYYIWSLLAFNFSPGDRGNLVNLSEGENKGNPKGTVISQKLLETPAEIVLDPEWSNYSHIYNT